MYEHSTLIRQPDGKVFTVKRLAHWSEIIAEDGETYQVKWLGGDEYIAVDGTTFMELK